MGAPLVEFQSSRITLEDAWQAVLIVHPKDQNLGTIKPGSALGTQCYAYHAWERKMVVTLGFGDKT